MDDLDIPAHDDATDTAAPAAAETRTAATPSRVMKMAQTAVGAQVGRVSEILINAADSIDDLLGGSNSPLPEGAKTYVASTSGKLRDLADRATEEEAGKMVEALQRTAASHPAATAGIGAALGAVLGLVLAKLGGPVEAGSSVKTTDTKASRSRDAKAT